ncbi:uncharacterized protein LOC118198264 [Stegodyphus dumicola]|uniref:uncharacterized protein LOC118198264 n=1 Tax=Stegodyphus dumicola TaxID=202533 RepID=UPI0015AC17BB|nr:uncharacterized protein LOC118198264 [Stegodyphus dumicola]
MRFLLKFGLVVVIAAAVLGIASCASKKHSKRGHKLDDELLYNELLEAEFEDDHKTYADAFESSGAETNPEEVEEKGCSKAARKKTDQYIDKVLDEVRPKLPEPAFLPERVGRFRLFNGTLVNLASIKRSGPALVRCSDSTFSFLVPVGLRNLTGRYYWETDAGVPVFRGFIDMFIRRLDADVFYTRQRHDVLDESAPKATVEKFTITRLDGVQVKFDGLGPLNAIASRFTNLVVRFFNRGVSRALEGPVKNAINKELENVSKYEYYYF